MEKCRYYNDHQTCCILFLDDFSLTATSCDGRIYPFNDWGYGMLSKNSLFEYLYETLLRWCPEIKGTIFMPLLKHRAQNPDSGYRLFFRDYGIDFRDFYDRISDRFEIAFHGLHHGRFTDNPDPSFKSWQNEFEYYDIKDTAVIRQSIISFESATGIKLRGGKTPGYRQNEHARGIVEELGFDWWASSSEMMNRRSRFNKPSYFGKKRRVLDIPTHISGDIFSRHSLSLSKYPFSLIKFLKTEHSLYRNRYNLSYLYEKGIPITIQEHCQNLRTDGRRQRYNLFDDIFSVAEIYNTLRGYDIWHCTCSEYAGYYDAWENTQIRKGKNGVFEVLYKGQSPDTSVTIRSEHREIMDKNLENKLHGMYKNGKWIFNGLKPGVYQII